MSTQSVTLRLPDPLYQRWKRRAEQTERPMEEELLDVVAAAVPADDELSPELTEALAALALLEDEELWRAARVRLPVQESEELEALHLKRQSEGLTPTEAERAAQLVRHYERSMLLRAQAAALLKQRGHDVSVLLTAA